MRFRETWYICHQRYVLSAKQLKVHSHRHYACARVTALARACNVYVLLNRFHVTGMRLE